MASTETPPRQTASEHAVSAIERERDGEGNQPGSHTHTHCCCTAALTISAKLLSNRGMPSGRAMCVRRLSLPIINACKSISTDFPPPPPPAPPPPAPLPLILTASNSCVPYYYTAPVYGDAVDVLCCVLLLQDRQVRFPGKGCRESCRLKEGFQRLGFLLERRGGGDR